MTVSVRFKTLINRSTVIPESQKQGKTLFETEPQHKVTEQYRQLAAEIESRVHAASQSTTTSNHQATPETDFTGSSKLAEVVNG